MRSCFIYCHGCNKKKELIAELVGYWKKSVPLHDLKDFNEKKYFELKQKEYILTEYTYLMAAKELGLKIDAKDYDIETFWELYEVSKAVNNGR